MYKKYFSITTPAGYYTTGFHYLLQEGDRFRVTVQYIPQLDKLESYAFRVSAGIVKADDTPAGCRCAMSEIVYVPRHLYSCREAYLQEIMRRETTAQLASNARYLMGIDIDADYHSLRRVLKS